MTDGVCDISQANVVVVQNWVSCGGLEDAATSLLIQGATTTYNISVSDSDLVLKLSAVSITSLSPLSVVGSAVRVVLTGESHLTGVGSSGLSCDGGSNVTLSADDATGSAVIVGSDGYAGIGSDLGDCLHIGLDNGSYRITGGESGAGLGSGPGVASSPSRIGTIHLSNADVDAIGGENAAGIGAGYGSSGTSSVGNLVITGGTVTGTGGRYGAGIGSGRADTDSSGAVSSVDNLAISGGKVAGKGGEYGAGIGAAYGLLSKGTSSVGVLAISGGNVSGIGGTEGAGIGAGYGTSKVTRIEVTDGLLTLNSSRSGIGFGSSTSVVDVLRILNGVFDCTGVTASACFAATAVQFGAGSTSVITRQENVVSSAGWAISGSANLYFEYISTSSREVNLVQRPMIHVKLVTLPFPTTYAMAVHKIDANGNDAEFEREVTLDWTRAQGFAFSVREIGNYSISFTIASSGVVGRLHHDWDFVFGAEVQGDNFFLTADYAMPSGSLSCPAPTLTWATGPEFPVLPWTTGRVFLLFISIACGVGVAILNVWFPGAGRRCRLIEESEEVPEENKTLP
jgi:hypothetical protein